ncbi:hypothetical protein [Hymenobacter baengnokdamensis]|uniref:hypothetical protein n=1 Tax=Hymenobacter baengnokdamensis TaxID=2615203 RepID=UPI0012447B51|nr:hypothetical protein [Hymenobacter baengnokdamensis]
MGLWAAGYTLCANAQVLLSAGAKNSNGVSVPISTSKLVGLEMGSDEVDILFTYSITSNTNGCNEISYLSVEHRDAGTVNRRPVLVAATKTRVEIPDTPPDSVADNSDDSIGEPYIRNTTVYEPPARSYRCQKYKYLIQIKLWQGKRAQTGLAHTISLTSDGEIKHEGPIAGEILNH